jgi:hypothetical protein
LNTEFDISKMSSDERRQLVSEWQSGAIAFEEMRDLLVKNGIASFDLNKAKAAIDAEQQVKFEQKQVEAALFNKNQKTSSGA